MMMMMMTMTMMVLTVFPAVANAGKAVGKTVGIAEMVRVEEQRKTCCGHPRLRLLPVLRFSGPNANVRESR